MIFVIGSGPAGVSCAAALLERGVCVTILDAGIELDENKRKVLTATQTNWNTLPPSKISLELTHTLNSKNPIKWVYGSDYPYADVLQHIPIQSIDNDVHCLPSFATGGLSNAWGAFCAQYDEQDIFEWPIKASQLAPYYKKIFTFLNCATARNSNESLKCLTNTYESSSQAQSLLSRLSAFKEKLNILGFQFGSSQLAVNFNHKLNISCNYCSQCQYGCPAELIYSSSHTLSTLLKNQKLTYIKDIVVDYFDDSASAITIYTYNRITKEKRIFTGSQVFCGCGPIITTALVLKSMNAYNHKINFYDSAHFMLPCLMHDRIKDVSSERLHTLCQLFLKLENSAVSMHPVHLQIYTYMDHYVTELQQLLKAGFRILAPLLNPFIDRLIIIQGYLHSSDSHSFSMHIDAHTNFIQLATIPHSSTKKIIKHLLKHLMAHRKILGITPIKPMLKMSKAGKSFHYGGSIPMRSNPQEFEADIFGKPFGFKRLHLIDATLFPTIPAGSITPTIMANAYRIGSECDLV